MTGTGLLLSGLVALASAEAEISPSATEKPLEFYLAVNPAAAFYGLTEGSATYVYPFLTGHEYGVALSAGVALYGHNTLELRLSAGRPNSISHYTQAHLGYLFHVLEYFGITDKGLYAGIFAKFVDNSQRQAAVHYYSFIPYLAVGYRLQGSAWFVDLRLQQTLLAVTASDAPHTGVGVAPMFSPVPGMSPVLPSLVLNIGVIL